ncbi:MAG: YihY/virulence factor BrkB family protein [bacterium]
MLSLLKETFYEWRENKAARLAAALAYYTVFSTAPLLIVVIAIAGLAFGRDAAQGEIVRQLQWLVGQNAAETIQGIIEAARTPATGISAGTIGVLTLLLGAMGVFGQLQDALNTIWDAPPAPSRGVWGLVRGRFLSFTMLLGTGFLLLVSLVISAGLSALEGFFGRMLPLHPGILHALNSVFSFAVITVLFAMIYKVLPDVEIQWKHVWAGAAMTSILFVLGKFLIGLYLGRGSFTSAFGAAGSLVVLLLWVYYSAQIFLFGAEFTQVWARRAGAHAQHASITARKQPMEVETLRTRRLEPARDTAGWLGFLTGLLVGYATIRGESQREHEERTSLSS